MGISMSIWRNKADSCCMDIITRQLGKEASDTVASDGEELSEIAGLIRNYSPERREIEHPSNVSGRTTYADRVSVMHRLPRRCLVYYPHSFQPCLPAGQNSVLDIRLSCRRRTVSAGHCMRAMLYPFAWQWLLTRKACCPSVRSCSVRRSAVNSISNWICTTLAPKYVLCARNVLSFEW